MRFFIIKLALLLISFDALAVQKINEVNYFASLRANETNVRAGPGQNYPIKFTYKLKGIPMQVISEYDNWNEIKDYEGQSGWVMQSLLTKKRTLMIRTTNDFVNLYKKNNEKSRVLYRLENNVIGNYLKCVEGWCAMEVADKKGWVKADEVFGVD
jgi:SH3-like domain-containing protein